MPESRCAGTTAATVPDVGQHSHPIFGRLPVAISSSTVSVIRVILSLDTLAPQASAKLARSRRLAGTRTHASGTATGRTGVEAGKSVEVVDAEVDIGVAVDGGKRRKVFTPPTVTASLVRVDV